MTLDRRLTNCRLAAAFGLLLAVAPMARAQESRPAESAPATVTTAPEPQPTSLPTFVDSARTLRLKASEAAHMVSINNADLKFAYYRHLIERTRIAETQARFEPRVFSELSVGNQDVLTTPFLGSDQVLSESTTTLDSRAGLRGFLPTGMTYELSMNTEFRDSEFGGTLDPSSSTTTSLTLTQPVLRMAWLQYNDDLPEALARNNEGIARQQFRSDVIQKTFEVHQAYWEYVFAIQNLEVARQSLDLAGRLLDINKVKVRTGVFAPIEIVAAEAGVASRTTDVLVAQNEIEERADALRRLILPFDRRDEWSVPIIAVDLPEASMPLVPAIEECVEIAQKERADLAASRLSLRNQAISVALADNETLPRLDLQAGVSYGGLAGNVRDSFVDAFDDSRGAENWNVGFIFELPLGNEAARSRLARARLERDQTIMNHRRLMLDIEAGIRSAHRNVLISRSTIESRKKALELKQEEVKNEQVKLDKGRSTNFQVLQVQDDLSQRRSELLRAYADHRISIAQLAAAVGSTPEVLGWNGAGR